MGKESSHSEYSYNELRFWPIRYMNIHITNIYCIRDFRLYLLSWSFFLWKCHRIRLGKASILWPTFLVLFISLSWRALFHPDQDFVNQLSLNHSAHSTTSGIFSTQNFVVGFCKLKGAMKIVSIGYRVTDSLYFLARDSFTLPNLLIDFHINIAK